MYKLHIGTVEPLAEYIHIYQHLDFSMSELLHHPLTLHSRSLAVHSHRIHSPPAVILRYPPGMFNADGIHHPLLAGSKLPDTAVQALDTGTPVQYRIHLFHLIIPIGPPFLQTVNEPLLAAGTNGYIIEHRQHAFFNKLGNTPRSNQYLEQFREPPTVQAARCGSHTQFLCGRITLPHLRVRSSQGMMSLVYHNQSRSITRLIPVPGQPLDRHHPDRSILPPDTIFSQRFLHLRHQFPTMGNKPYPAAGRRHELTDHRCQQMCLARTGRHLYHHIPMKLPLLKEAELHLLLVITKSVVWVIHKRMPATTGNKIPMGR